MPLRFVRQAVANRRRSRLYCSSSSALIGSPPCGSCSVFEKMLNFKRSYCRLNMQAFKSSEFARECGNALLSAFHNQRDCVCFFSGYAHSADYNICKITQNFLHFDCNRLVASKHDSDYADSFHNYLFCAVARLYLCKAQVILMFQNQKAIVQNTMA